MRKIVALLILAGMLLSGAPALGEVFGQEVAALARQLVKGVLDQHAFQYTYDGQNDCFNLQFSLDSALSSAKVSIYVYDDMVSVVAYSPWAVAIGNRDRMAKFLTLANNEIYYSQFRMNYQTGLVSCRSYQLIEGVLPGAGEIGVLLQMPLQYMNRFGDGIAQISASEADPQAAFEACLAKRSI